MTPYPKRLIEVDLPIARISAHARREKESRQGHVPQILIYPAARPVAACRGVILAALWPDPVDLSMWHSGEDTSKSMPPGSPPQRWDGTVRPHLFLEEAKARMTRWASTSLHKVSAESYTRLVAVQHNPALLDDPTMLRGVLLDFIADFCDPAHASDREYLETARSLVQAAHTALGGDPRTRPMIVDPFAGGGAIPLEALRVGAESFATDLNPIAIALNRILADFIPRRGMELVEELERWQTVVQEQASKRLGRYYPRDPDGSMPIAYLWARVIVSEAPTSGELPVEVPLLRTMWLAKKGIPTALRWILGPDGLPKTRIAEVEYADGIKRRVRQPLMEVFVPKTPREVPSGTIRRGSATCPITQHTTPADRVQQQIARRFGGTEDARMYCVVVDRPSSGRIFRVASLDDQAVARTAAAELANVAGVSQRPGHVVLPEPTPKGGGRGAGRAFAQRAYGMATFGDLFLSRQILALDCYADLTRAYVAKLRRKDPLLAEALSVCVGLLIGRLADQNAALTTWQLNTKNAAHVFVRWAMQMVWDFAEVNPLAAAGGSPDSAIRRMTGALRTLLTANLQPGNVLQASADRHPLPDDAVDALVTDPPYYDAIPYSDILDFFYIWLRRVQESTVQEHEAVLLCPKDDECIVDEMKGKDPTYFERMMTSCLAEQRRIVRPGGVGVVVFAHKSTSGWERLLQAVIDAGWVITGSWPIDTELGNRLRAMNSAALASSIHLVCRPRENIDGSVVATEIGEWREVLVELPRRIEEWMPRLADEGVVGADAIFACLGPALEVFSRYTRVERASGEAVTLGEYLEHVWAAVSNEALSMIFKGADAAGLEPDARLTAMWLWTIGGGKSNGTVEAGDAEYESAAEDDREESSGNRPKLKGFALEFDAARKIAQGLGVHLEKLVSIVEVKGETARLLPVAERVKTLFGKDSEAGGGGATVQPKGKRKRAEATLFQSAEEVKAEIISAEAETAGKLAAARPGATVLDRVHQAMLLFSAGRGDALKRFLVDDGIGKDGRFWKLAQSLSALYPAGTDEKRWVDGVLARKKGLGF